MLARGHRLERLADRIREEIEEMIAGELADPRIGFASVTRVDLSPDFRHARVAVLASGEEDERAQTLEGLASAARFVRREVGLRLQLKRTPEVVFVRDRDAEAAAKAESLAACIPRGRHGPGRKS
jgi:ribosome-binding factor A